MSKTFTFDYDETITSAPKQLAVISGALRAQGHKVVVLTGSPLPRKDIVKQLDDYGFPYDDLVQYVDEGSNGLQRAKYLKELDCWCGFDNRADRAHTYAEVAPHLYLIAKVDKDMKQNADDALDKKQVKKDVKKQTKRCVLRGGPLHGQTVDHRGLSETMEFEIDGVKHLYCVQSINRVHPNMGNDEIANYRQDLSVPSADDTPIADPPNLRKADSDDQCCATCWMYDQVEGTCWAYHNKSVKLMQVCDTWEARPVGQP